MKQNKTESKISVLLRSLRLSSSNVCVKRDYDFISNRAVVTAHPQDLFKLITMLMLHEQDDRPKSALVCTQKDCGQLIKSLSVYNCILILRLREQNDGPKSALVCAQKDCGQFIESFNVYNSTVILTLREQNIAPKSALVCAKKDCGQVSKPVTQPDTVRHERIPIMLLHEQCNYRFPEVASTQENWSRDRVTNRTYTESHYVNFHVSQSGPVTQNHMAIVSLKEHITITKILKYQPACGLKDAFFSTPLYKSVQTVSFADSEEKAKRFLLANRIMPAAAEHSMLFQAYIACYWGSEASCRKGDKKVCPENLVTSLAHRMPTRSSKCYDQELMNEFLKNSKRDAFVWNIDRFTLAEVMPNQVSLLDFAAVRAKESETWAVATDEKPSNNSNVSPSRC